MKPIVITSRKLDAEKNMIAQELESLGSRLSRAADQIVKCSDIMIDDPFNKFPSTRSAQIDLDDLLSQKSDLEEALAGARLRFEELDRSLVEPLETYLAEINGRAKTHTLSAEDVITVADHAESMLQERGVLIKHRKGAEVHFRPAGMEACNAYNRVAGPRNTTSIHLRRVGDGWRLLSAERDLCYVNQQERRLLSIPSSAAQDVRNHAFRGIDIQRDDKAA